MIIVKAFETTNKAIKRKLNLISAVSLSGKKTFPKVSKQKLLIIKHLFISRPAFTQQTTT